MRSGLACINLEEVLTSLPAGNDAVGASQVAMRNDIARVKKHDSLDEIMDETCDEHWLQLDVFIFQDVLERTLGAEVRDQHHTMGLNTGSNKTEKKYKKL